MTAGDTVNRLAIIALGSNLGDSVQILRAALERLQTFSAGQLQSSSLWQTAPIDCPPGSPPFVNAVAVFVPRENETPESLLAILQAIELEFGRAPKLVLNEPRSLDLDLIAFGKETCSTPSLTLPHPRAHLRRFVLAPLDEITPGLILPGQSRTVRELLASLPNVEQAARLD